MGTATCINTLAAEIHATAVQKGFWDPGLDTNLGTRLMLIVTELGEAMEEYRRNGVTDHFGEELADVFIRLLDVAEGYGVDLGAAVDAKMTRNRERPRLHGKRF
ncbi:MAG: nucleotide pyrophosphohydrolase [Actinomycetia bacterium]|nr:nucleotide pyrophosphohydrolase [Actinomycetes bacterium]